MNKKTLVIGASTNESRYSNLAIKKFTRKTTSSSCAWIKEGSVAGVDIQTTRPTDKDFDTVTMYVSPKNQDAFVDYVIDLKPKRVLFNPGTENPKFYKKLNQAGISYE